MATIKRIIHAPWVQAILYLLLIALLTYLFLWRLWAAAPEDRAYLPEKSDLGEVFFPPRYYFAKTLAQDGEFPLWNPHVYSGYPQFADPQAATFYPIALLFAGVAGTQYSMDTIALNIGLHFFLVGAFSFLFFRHLFKSNLAALLSALIFEFGGYLTFYPSIQLSELEVVAWFPLTLLFITLSIERRNSLLMAIAGVSLGQIFLAGRPQSYLSAGAIAVAWLVYTAYHANISWSHIIKKGVLLAGFALGIAAVQWMPTLQLTELSTRSVLTYAEVAEGGFPFEQLTGFFMPQLLGTQNLYVGLLTLLLAGIALYHRKGLFWAGVLLVGLFGSVGKYLVLFDALYLIERLGFPGYLRNVERLAFAITFSLAALSGYGLLSIEKVDKTLLRLVGTIMGIILFVSLLLSGLWSVSGSSTELNTAVNALSFVGLILLGGLLALWLFRDHPTMAKIALVAIAVSNVMSVNQGRFFVEQIDSFALGNDVQRVINAPQNGNGVYRTVFDQTTSQDFGSLAGVDNVGGMPPLMLKDYERLRGVLDEYRRNILLNVEMIVTTGSYDDPAFELVAQEDEFNYYRFVVAKPRAYLVENVIEVADTAKAAEIVAAPEFDYWNTAVLIGNSGLKEKGSNLFDFEYANIIDRSANAMRIQTNAQEPRLLVVSDTYYPGWQATIDGVPTELYKTNVALRGVVVPAGVHTVLMQFRPTIFFAGLFTSLFTVLILLVWAGVSVVRRRKQSATR